MKTGKTGEDVLKSKIGERLKSVVRAEGAQNSAVADALGVPLSTFNSWLGGIHYPAMASLVKFAGLYKVSLDWILTGQESLLPKDQREEDFVIRYRSLVERGVAEPLEAFMAHQIDRARVKDESKAMRVQAGRAFHLDTFGKRLCYVRESEEGQEDRSPAAMAERLGLTERAYLDIEGDEVLPGTRVLTALTGLLMDPETKDQSIIDWLLEG